MDADELDDIESRIEDMEERVKKLVRSVTAMKDDLEAAHGYAGAINKRLERAVELAAKIQEKRPKTKGR